MNRREPNHDRDDRLIHEVEEDFAVLKRRPVVITNEPASVSVGAVPSVAYFDGFDLEDQPLISGISHLPGEIVAARTTVPLFRSHIGSAVVVMFDRGDARRPIVVGVVEGRQSRAAGIPVSVRVDDDCMVLSAEREIVLQCGEASITLTRAGKIVIKGKYVVSRSSGYNKIKGAAVDIN